MDADRYSVSQLVTDLKELCARFGDERDLLGAVRPLARRAGSRSACTAPTLSRASGCTCCTKKPTTR